MSIEDLSTVAGPVSRETYEALQQFRPFFQKWAARINLVSKSSTSDIWSRHILDSAQLVSFAPGADNWLDLGSGSGFPGLIVGFLLKDRPGASVELVESNRKKAAFLHAAIAQFSLPAVVHAERIESAKPLKRPQIVTARALAPLPLLLQLAQPWLVDATGLFHKGRDYHAELEESAHHWHFDLVEHRSKVDPQGVILEIRNLRPKL